MMMSHGTMPWTPSVRVILQTATYDLMRYRENGRLKSQRQQFRAAGASALPLGRAYSYGFLLKHISGCSLESEILQKAVDDRDAGLKRGLPIGTQHLYKDEKALREAILVAKKYGR